MRISRVGLLISFLLYTVSVHAQFFYLEDINIQTDQALYKKIHTNPDIHAYYPFTDGHGQYPDLHATNTFPKKVALISFYVWDNKLVEQKISPLNYWNATTWINTEGKNRLANELARYSIPAIRHRFDSLGTTLVLPSDFTPEQKEYYNTFAVNYTKSYRSKVPDSINYETTSSQQFRFIKISAEKLDYKFATDLGLLAKQLEVDAVLIIENHITFDAYAGILEHITMNLYGPNPVKKSDNIKYSKKAQGYNEGLLFISLEMEIAGMFAQFESEQLTYENYGGYDRMIMLMIDQLYINYDARMKIAPKKT